jgi:hypothetical protein
MTEKQILTLRAEAFTFSRAMRGLKDDKIRDRTGYTHIDAEMYVNAMKDRLVKEFPRVTEAIEYTCKELHSKRLYQAPELFDQEVGALFNSLHHQICAKGDQ